jgi:hypothetical protein
MKGKGTVADSEGVSNLVQESSEPVDELGAALPSLGSIATVVQKLVTEGLSIDEAAQKVAAWVDPSLMPALQTLASVLQEVAKFV